MNKPEFNMLKAAAELLRGRGIHVDIKQGTSSKHRKPQADTYFRLGHGKQRITYAVEAKAHPTTSTVGALVAQLKHLGQTIKKPVLLVTSYVTAPVADTLTALDQQYLDTVGNAYLKAPGVLVLVSGRKPDSNAKTSNSDRAFTITGLKTLFALLCKPELAEASYRGIAQAANVALGALPAVLQSLQQASHLHIAGRKRKLIATKRLLDEWAIAYARTLRPKQLLRTLTTSEFDKWRSWDLYPDDAKWGGEPAAALLTKHLRPGILTIYASKIPAHLIMKQHMTNVHQPEQRVIEIRKVFWGKTLQDSDRPDLVATLLVYADLLATADARCIEAAQILYENNLAQCFPST